MNKFYGIAIAIVLTAASVRAQSTSEEQKDSMVLNLRNGRTITFALSDIRKIVFDTLTSSVPQNQTNSDPLVVFPSYPDPANGTVTFRFELAQAGNVTLTLRSLGGNTISTLRLSDEPPGLHTITWDGKDSHGLRVSGGSYYYEITFKGILEHGQFILLK